VQTRLQIQQQANASERREHDPAERAALDGQRATLDQSAYEQRAAAIQVRGNALNRKVSSANANCR
jgi:outer membrane protein